MIFIIAVCSKIRVRSLNYGKIEKINFYLNLLIYILYILIFFLKMYCIFCEKKWIYLDKNVYDF